MPALGSSARSDERRQAVVRAAISCFARKGYYGTTTQEIAQKAGISQPYVYRLFETKEALFVACIEQVAEVMSTTMLEGTSALTASQSLAEKERAVREAYSRLVADTEVPRFFMQANCATGEPSIGAAVRLCYAQQVSAMYQFLEENEEAVRRWFGAGMLENVSSILRLTELDEPWANIMSQQ